MEVMPLGNSLKQKGYEVVIPLLPGHKMMKNKMERVKALDWIDTIDKIVLQKTMENRKVHIIGFSMGAMLGALMAKRYAVSTLVLLSPAVYVVTPKVMAHRTKKAFQMLKEDRMLFRQTAFRNLVSMKSAPLYNVIQFKKVVQRAKKVIPDIDIPICILHGLDDELADPKSSEWIYQTISSKEKELHTLPLSGHLICHGTEANVLIEIVVQFIEKHSDVSDIHMT